MKNILFLLFCLLILVTSCIVKKDVVSVRKNNLTENEVLVSCVENEISIVQSNKPCGKKGQWHLDALQGTLLYEGDCVYTIIPTANKNVEILYLTQDQDTIAFAVLPLNINQLWINGFSGNTRTSKGELAINVGSEYADLAFASVKYEYEVYIKGDLKVQGEGFGFALPAEVQKFTPLFSKGDYIKLYDVVLETSLGCLVELDSVTQYNTRHVFH